MITRIDDASYSLDILHKLLEKGMVTDPKYDYLLHKQQGAITEEHREKLYGWMFTVCDTLATTDYTKELSWLMTDYYLKTKPAKKSILQLLGIWSIHIAIKLNESFMVDLKVLADLWANQYTDEQILKFEEILLNTLNWSPYLPTSCEIYNHFWDFLKELSISFRDPNDKDTNIITSLKNIFGSNDFIKKVRIFNQIALLDYRLSRYGSSILAIVSILCVLKTLEFIAEYNSFSKIVLEVLRKDSSLYNFIEAKTLAMEMFSITESDAINQDPDVMFDVQDYDDINEEHNQDLGKDINKSFTSDNSHSTTSKSSTSSPTPPFSRIISSKKREVEMDDLISAKDKRKHKKFQIKRKVICKRML